MTTNRPEARFDIIGAVNFAHFGRALFKDFKHFDLVDIGYKQPKSLPYPTETPFCLNC